MAPVCHVCKHTGERICDPTEAEIRCMICGRCEAERLAAGEQPTK